MFINDRPPRAFEFNRVTKCVAERSAEEAARETGNGDSLSWVGDSTKRTALAKPGLVCN